MKKVAIFVEGQTELLFIDRLIQAVGTIRGMAVEHAQASGGASHARRIKVLKQVATASHHRIYILIVNCGGDSKVKSDIMERYQNLVRAGYSAILGLRDVYGQFRYEDVPRLRQAMQAGLPGGEPSVSIYLAVMEIEAWFLAEYTHFARMDPKVTPEKVQKHLHLDVRGNLERRSHPASDLDRVYRLARVRYSKQRSAVERTLDRLDFDFLISDVARRFEDLDRLIENLSRQLSQA